MLLAIFGETSILIDNFEANQIRRNDLEILNPCMLILRLMDELNLDWC